MKTILNDHIEESFQLMADISPNAVILVNMAGEISLLNAKAELLFGYSREELIGQPIEMLVPQQFRGDHRQYRDTFSEHPTTRPMGAGRDLFGLCKDGRLVPLEIGLNPMMTIKGKFVLASIIDITKRKEAEAALRESEKRYRRTIDSMFEGCQIIGFDWRYLYINEAAAKQGKQDIERLLGRTMMEVYPGIEQSEMFAVLQQCMEKREPAHIENEFFFPDGTTGWFELSIQPIPEGVFILSVDVTQRKQFEKHITEALQREQSARIAVEKAHQRLSFLADAGRALASSLEYHKTLNAIAKLVVPHIADWCAVDMVAPDGSLNRVAAVHTDPEIEPFVFALQRYHPTDPNSPHGVFHVLSTGQPEFHPHISGALLESAGLDEEQLNFYRTLGLRSSITVPILVRDQPVGVISCVFGKSGRVYDEDDLKLLVELANRAGLAIDNARLYHEASELNEALEYRVKERTTQLEAANEELEAFSYSVSHDLRAPLRSINGFSQALLEDYAGSLEEQGQHYLRRVIAATQKMAGLIDDLLTLSRLTRNEMNPEPVHLSDLVQDIVAQLEQRKEAERVVKTVIAPQVIVQADAQLMRIALENLLENAWKFTAREPHARIEFGFEPQPDGRTAYFIRDNGAGFDMAYSDKLFGAFQRLHSESEFPGTGIGLATVQRIVHRHGGQVWAEGAVGEGAAFYFTLYDASVANTRDSKRPKKPAFVTQ